MTVVKKPTKAGNNRKKIETNSKGNLRGTSPASKSNLIPGGPGRPKGKLNYDTRVDMAIEVLAKKYVETENAKNKNKKGYVPLTLDDVDIEGDIFAQHLNKARNGDRHFIDSFLDRRHGKATARIELSGIDGDPIVYEERKKEAKSKARRMLDLWTSKK